MWRGKDEQNWSDLVVQTPPLFIQEKWHPKALVADLLRQSRKTEEAHDRTPTSSRTSTVSLARTREPEFYQQTPTGRTA